VTSWTGSLAILWAKLGHSAARTKPRYHPLLCHLLDVAVVARELWQSVLSVPARQHVADALGLDVDAAGAWIAFWAGVHDIGKACPAFQHRSDAFVHVYPAHGLPIALDAWGERGHRIEITMKRIALVSVSILLSIITTWSHPALQVNADTIDVVANRAAPSIYMVAV
jgi:hypothetical protein